MEQLQRVEVAILQYSKAVLNGKEHKVRLIESEYSLMANMKRTGDVPVPFIKLFSTSSEKAKGVTKFCSLCFGYNLCIGGTVAYLV